MITKNLIPQYSDIKELQQFAEAQFSAIIELSKQIEDYKTKVQMLEGALKSVSSQNKSNLSELVKSDEEAICKLEIQKLRDRTLQGPLTYEESKKLQIYVELLLKIQNKPKTLEIKTKSLKDEELLALLENNESTNGNH